MDKWFTADNHFDHDSIIDYCQRPWTGRRRLDQMNKALIDLWNEVVKPGDDIYHLGDLSIRTKSHSKFYEWLLPKLNGNIHLILGNHDVKDPWFYSRLGVLSIHCPYLQVEEFYCVHDPALSQVLRNEKFLVGHIHDLFLKVKNCVNVGVDVHNYKPVHIDDVRKIFTMEDSINEDSLKFKEGVDPREEHIRGQKSKEK